MDPTKITDNVQTAATIKIMEQYNRQKEASNRWYKKEYANNPDFKKAQHTKSTTWYKNKMTDDPEYKAARKVYFQEYYLKNKEIQNEEIKKMKNSI